MVVGRRYVLGWRCNDACVGREIQAREALRVVIYVLARGQRGAMMLASHSQGRWRARRLPTIERQPIAIAR